MQRGGCRCHCEIQEPLCRALPISNVEQKLACFVHGSGKDMRYAGASQPAYDLRVSRRTSGSVDCWAHSVHHSHEHELQHVSGKPSVPKSPVDSSKFLPSGPRHGVKAAETRAEAGELCAGMHSRNENRSTVACPAAVDIAAAIDCKKIPLSLSVFWWNEETKELLS